MTLDRIPKSLHSDVIANYWMMLRELEVQADNENDPILKISVQGHYALWNKMTGDNKQPRWMKT